MRYEHINFDKILIPTFKELDEEEQAIDALARLGTNQLDRNSYMDIRQILCDNAIKEFTAKEDSRIIGSIRSAI
jgi:hypothetical protein